MFPNKVLQKSARLKLCKTHEWVPLCIACWVEQFIQRVKKNSDLTELTPYALRELVKAVYVEAPDKSVEAPDKSSGKRKQKIHICYDLIGFIPVDVLLKAEQA